MLRDATATGLVGTLVTNTSITVLDLEANDVSYDHHNAISKLVREHAKVSSPFSLCLSMWACLFLFQMCAYPYQEYVNNGADEMSQCSNVLEPLSLCAYDCIISFTPM